MNHLGTDIGCQTLQQNTINYDSDILDDSDVEEILLPNDNLDIFKNHNSKEIIFDTGVLQKRCT